jgi:hypothetical protein
MEEKGKYVESDNKRLRDGKNEEEEESVITQSLPHDQKLMQIDVGQNTLHCNVDFHEKAVVPKTDKKKMNQRVWRSGLPRTMSFVSWNCWGLSNPSIFLTLRDMTHKYRLDVIFLCETLVHADRSESS